MKQNTQYTAKEILLNAGFNPAETLGKVRVRIGGISGIVKESHLIRTPKEGKLDIIVGAENVEVELNEGADESRTSEEAKLVLESRAKKLAKQAKRNKKAKEEAE
jgi:hypothetical protein